MSMFLETPLGENARVYGRTKVSSNQRYGGSECVGCNEMTPDVDILPEENVVSEDLE